MLECNFKPFYRSKSFQSKTPHFFERVDTRNTKYLPNMCLKKLASNPIRIICQNSKRISLLFFIFVLCQMRLHLFLSCHFMQNVKKPFYLLSSTYLVVRCSMSIIQYLYIQVQIICNANMQVLKVC